MEHSKLLNCIERLRSGDGEAFRELYDDLKKPLFTMILRIVQERETAEDVIQELFVRLYKSPPGPEIRDARAYIFKMARNMAVDELRRQPRYGAMEELDEFVPARPEDAALRLDVEAAMRSLPLIESQIVTLHLNGGFKFREIAGMTDMPLGTVLTRYRAALGKLRKELSGGSI